ASQAGQQQTSGVQSHPALLVTTLCNDTAFMAAKDLSFSSKTDGWETIAFDVPAPSTNSTTSPTGLSERPRPVFDSIEFVAAPNVAWAIDDFAVWAQDAGGAWHAVAAWYGPGDNVGSYDDVCTSLPDAAIPG